MVDATENQSCNDSALIWQRSYSVLYKARFDWKRSAPIGHFWQLPEVQKFFRKQQPDGAWTYKVKKAVCYPEYYPALVQTWKTFRILVEQYELTKKHEAAKKAAGFLFSCQTAQGDIRGFLANQYATYYTGAILSLLSRAGMKTTHA